MALRRRWKTPKATSPSSYSRCRTYWPGVDAIIVNPVDTNAVKPIMDQATKRAFR